MQYNPADGIDLFSTYFKRALTASFELNSFAPNKVLFLQEKKGNTEWIKPIFPEAEIDVFTGSNDTSWETLKSRIDETNADLIVSERLLFENHKDFDHSLGVYIEAVSQTFSTPLLIVGERTPTTGNVIVGFETAVFDTDIINKAMSFCDEKLILAHIIDKGIYDQFSYALDRVPDLVYSDFEEEIKNQLNQYVFNLSKGVNKALSDIDNSLHSNVISYSNIGVVSREFKDLIEKYKPSLLAFQSKDETQLAMHGLGYAMAVEFPAQSILLY